jgi:hypothetical protein
MHRSMLNSHLAIIAGAALLAGAYESPNSGSEARATNARATTLNDYKKHKHGQRKVSTKKRPLFRV